MKSPEEVICPTVSWITPTQNHARGQGLTSNERLITVIQGIPFYRSSGDNSKIGGTWEPFLGLGTGPIEFPGGRTLNCIGWLKKPASLGVEDDNLSKYKREHPLPGDHPYERFATLPCMLISSAIGDGVWSSEEGLNLKQQLMVDFPEFYQNFNIHLQPTGTVFDCMSMNNRSMDFLNVLLVHRPIF